jgi:hypothetical protein
MKHDYIYSYTPNEFYCNLFKKVPIKGSSMEIIFIYSKLDKIANLNEERFDVDVILLS